MAINFQSEEYKDNIDKWKLIDRVCEGDDDVQEYLIELNPDDKTPENIARNKAYKERAVFFPVAGRTAAGLNSLLFSDWPKLEVPTALDYLKDNATGSGVSIYQQAQDVAGDVIKLGRSALFVTYPRVEGPLSRADMDTGRYYATVHEIEADQVINWRVEKVGSHVQLSLVVFEEEVEVVQPDGYEVKCVDQLRELFLEGGTFFDRAWQKSKVGTKEKWVIVEGSKHMPLDGAGKPWDMIPFTFIGSCSNSPDVDDSIMYGLAKLNVAHYRNSADFEDSCWYVGQAQPWMSGVTQTHVDMMKKNNMYVGSRMMMGVPSGETFAFASADPNPMVRQAMLDKLDAMIGLGARYIQPGGVAKTATEDNNDEAVQHSALALISSNISEAYTQALVWIARYMNVPVTDAL